MGIPHTQTILMTNVSFSFNSFKLLPLHDSIKVRRKCALKMDVGLFFDSVHTIGENVGWSVHHDHYYIYAIVELRY